MPRGKSKDDAQVPHEDGYLMPNLTYANKCTQCARRNKAHVSIRCRKVFVAERKKKKKKSVNNMNVAT
jgi:hypothetical protein